MRTLVALSLLTAGPAWADCVYTGAKRPYIQCIYDQVLTNAADLIDHAASLLGLDARLTDAEGGVGALQSDLATAQGDITALGGAISSLDGAVSGLSSDLSDLSDEVSAIAGDVSAVQATADDLAATCFRESGGEIYGPYVQSLPGGTDFGGAQDGVAAQWTHFIAGSAANGGAGAGVPVSDFTFQTSQWRAIFEGEWNNNYEGGSLAGLPPIIEISNTVTTANPNPNTIRVGAVTLTFSRNATSGKLEASASASTGDARSASFRGMITIIPHRQGSNGGQSLSLSSGVDYAGPLNRAGGGTITGKSLRNVSAGTYTIYRADVHGAGIVVVKVSGTSAGTCRYTELGTFTDGWARLGNPKVYNPSGAGCPSVSVAVASNELRVTIGGHSYADLSLDVYGFGDLTVF
ncbi:MAG TPA: hypothetical protein PKA64_01315 [Myxococcota bacterium]|nr:hypothetical protein [Myxococcota bacterium]